MGLDGLSMLEMIREHACREISESEARIRNATAIKAWAEQPFEKGMSAYLAGLRFPFAPAGSGPQAAVPSEYRDGFIQEVRALLSELRASKGHLARLHLLAAACGGKLDLDDVGRFLVDEGFSDAKNVESLVKNLGTAINKDAKFARGPEAKRVYYLLSLRLPPTAPPVSSTPDQEGLPDLPPSMGETCELAALSDNGDEPSKCGLS